LRANQCDASRADATTLLSARTSLLRSRAMFRTLSFLFLFTASAFAAERLFDFTGTREGETPTGFRSVITGKGAPGEWKIVTDEVPFVIAPLSPKAPVTPKRSVLAQLSTDKNESRASMFILDSEMFGDFTFTTRIKLVSGTVEQMAGIAFRVQDERNYYYVRLNAKDHNVAFFRYVEGELIGPVSAAADVKLGEWNTLTIEFVASKFRALLNDKEVLPWTEANSVLFPDGSSKGVFTVGKVAFWTKADSVAHFADARMTYKPREKFASVLIRETMAAHPRLLGVKIFALPDGEKTPRMIASNDEKEIGQAGDTVEKQCIEKGGSYFGKGKELAFVTMPLHDRNGDIVGAVRVVMTTFIGQTEKNGLGRALPIVKSMEGRIVSGKELLE
jgi:hypothetical protein